MSEAATAGDAADTAPGGDAEPRWPAAVAVLAAAFLPFALPPSMRVVDPWLLATVVIVLVAAATLARHRHLHTVNQILGYAILAVLTVALLYGMAKLVLGVPRHLERAGQLLRSAAVLWSVNVIVFASWYWRLDAGGPGARDLRGAHTRGAFLFPQMAVDAPGQDGISIAEAEGWRPGFVDYLFLAFNTSTAFSPTDVPVLSRWAKLMMMLQASTSFVTVVLLAGRAVNIF